MPFKPTSAVFRVDQDAAGGGEGDSQVKVQVLNDASLVFVWREYEENESSLSRIFVRKYDQDLNPLTNQIRIGGAMTDQDGPGFTTPSIAATRDGGFVVEYDDLGGGTRYSSGAFYAGRSWSWLAGFDGDAAAYDQLPMLGVPQASDPLQNRSISNSTIAPNGKGGYHTLAVQGFIDNPDARYLLVNGQKVDIGLSPAGRSIPVNADIADAHDSALIVWSRGVAADDSDIFAMIVGQPMFKLNTQTQGLQTLSEGADAIAITSDGSFVVVWSDASSQDEASDPGLGVRARVIGSDGQPRSGEIILPLDPSGDESRPIVAAMDNGHWVAVWIDERGTVGQIFDPLGGRVGDEQVLIPGYSGIPAITMLPGNQLAVSWQVRSTDVLDHTLARVWQLAIGADTPVALADGPYAALIGEALNIGATEGVLANDTDFEGNPMTASLFGSPAHGSVILDVNGGFQYQPEAGFFGRDAFSYVAADDQGHQAAPATVAIEVFKEVAASPGSTIAIDSNYTRITGDPDDYSNSFIRSPLDLLLLIMRAQININAAFEQADVVPGIGSLVLNIDTDNDGSLETSFKFEDPVPNLTISVDPNGKGGTILDITSIAQSTANADTITGSRQLDYIGGGDGNDRLSGLAGNDALVGGNGNDFLWPGVGIDAANGGAGGDGIYFGAHLGAGDTADGGEGNDTLAIQGEYANLVLAGITNIEVLALLSGSDTRFGDIQGNLYDYVVRSDDINIAAGKTLTVSATGLLPGEDLSFDGSAETDGNFRIYTGRGVDSLTGGGGNDGFFFGADGNLTSADHVDGGAGIDSLALRGNYVGANAIIFQDSSFGNIEVLALLSGHSNEFSGVIVPGGYDYDVTTADGNVAAGKMLDINGARLGADEDLRFDGHLESDGTFRIFSGSGNDHLTGGAQGDLIYGGLGADTIDGGAGNDIYLYRSTAESTAAATDILTFASGDRIDLSLIDADGPGAGNAFAFIGSSAFSNVAGQLRASQTGTNQWTVEGDTNGDGAADLVIIVNAAAPLVVGDFVP
jgi:Ca2+-binding RTX toxin-like protein